MNQLEMHELNNCLAVINGLFKAAYFLTAKARDELYENGIISSPDPLRSSTANTADHPLNENALEKFKAKNYQVKEFNRYLQPELSALLNSRKMHAVVCRDKVSGNLIVCYDKRESGKMKELEQSLYGMCKNFQTDKKTLEKINANIDGANIRTLTGLSDFQYHILCEKMPQYQITFAGEVFRDGMHKIYFSSADDKKAMECLKDTTDYLLTPEGIENMKKMHVSEQVLRNIENEIKQNNTVYIVSEQNKFLKIEPDKFTVFEEKYDGRVAPMALRNNPIEGAVFRDSIWLNISENILEMNTPVNLDEESFNKYLEASYDERTELIENRVHAIEDDIKLESDRSPEEVMKELAAGLDMSDRENVTIEELE